MPIFEKKIYSDRFNVYFLNHNVYYQRETEDEIKKDFYALDGQKVKKRETKSNDAIRYYANSKKILEIMSISQLIKSRTMM